MPSYARHNYRRFPKNRCQLLRELRDKNMRRAQLEQLFSPIMNKFLPSKKPPVAAGYARTIFNLARPPLSKKRFQQLFYELRRDGLIDESNQEENRVVRITKRGLAWLGALDKQPPLARPAYAESPEKSDRVTIISYDIPEKARIYRTWIRTTLKSMKCTQLQQSLWFGKIKIPEEFIADLIRFNLKDCVEIFEITKAGTLRHRP